MKKLVRGAQIKPFALQDIHGDKIDVPDMGRWTHLQFRRFSGCMICNLHLQTLIGRYSEIVDAGISELVFFQSNREALLDQFADIPIRLIADPEGEYYQKFGVGNSVMSVANPLVVLPAMRGMFKFGIHFPKKEESFFGLPADILIDGDGKIVAVHYGKHAYDQWSVDHLLNLVKHEGVVV